VSTAGGIPQPFLRSRRPSYASAHQPSSTPKFTVPLIAAFMPDVPLASNGCTGVLSQMSTPETRSRLIPMS
jgi:hypothetical protein